MLKRISLLTLLVGLVVGLTVGLALGVLAVALQQGSEPDTAAVLLAATVTPASSPGLPTPVLDTRPRTLTAQDVRTGPNDNYAIIGLLSRGDAVDVVGRTADGKWLSIRFPPGSNLTGWIPLSSLSEGFDASLLRVATPAVLPIPFPTPFPTTPLSTLTGTATATAAGPQLPDLAVLSLSLTGDGHISVVIANIGGLLADGFTFVRLNNRLGQAETLQAPGRSLAAGATVSLATQQLTADTGTIIRALVDPDGSIREGNEGNNTLEVALGVTPTPAPAASQTSTPTPTPSGGASFLGTPTPTRTP